MKGDSARRVAVIDIGTNTLLLLVAEVEKGDDGRLRLHSVRDECEFGRLGRGLDQSGSLSHESIDRSLAIVGQYRKFVDKLGVTAIGAVGTQALREAENATLFVEPAEKVLGVPIEIIAGEREARLVYRAVAESFPDLVGEDFVVADVGGGSTEVIVASSESGTVDSFVSVPIGSARMHERHLHSDPPTPEQMSALVADIDKAFSALELPRGARLVGTAGTATTIASVELGLGEYDPGKIQGFSLSSDAVASQLDRLAAASVAERRAIPGMPTQRADVIVAGVAIFARLLHQLGGNRLMISDRGVRWGLAYELVSSM